MYGFLPWDVARFSRQQLDMYLHYVPDIAYRDAYPIARLTAAVKNLAGGKAEAGAGAEDFDPDRWFTPEDELPWFARAPKSTGSDPGLAKAIIASRTRLPRWAVSLINWERLEQEALLR